MIRSGNLCLIFLLGVLLTFFSCSSEKQKRVLIFTKTLGFRHSSIPKGKEVLMKLCRDNHIIADTTENADYFVTDSLKKYIAVIFLNTTGNVLNHVQQAHFERYIQAGGGYMGVHSATDTEYKWPWYNRLVGAYFESHPKQQEAVIDVVDKSHPAGAPLPEKWKRFDEWYNFKSIQPDIHVLAKLDESTYEGGKNGRDHPFAWYHEFDGGRAFYTEGGHTNASYDEPLFQKHLLGGLQYAIGDNHLDYDKAYTPLVPEENRFVKKVLIRDLNEPEELEVFKDGKVLFTERKGALKLYDPKTDTVKLVAQLNVETKFEDGLMGLALDPDYYHNHWIYLYYSKPGDDWMQNLSRFVFIADSLLLNTEKVLLQVHVQRLTCCHTGGSIEFGPGGLLYLSTGDDSSPFNTKELKYNSDGEGPMNEMPGWFPYDAQKSSANTNDLRGKVLRIKPEPDGTYSIPDGNLFPKDGTQGRPEIYVMGCRNPYRIGVDQKTGILYYGDVGPDAGEDTERGPRGYDEVNQVKKAGFFGWPYFIGNNRPYHKYNYATGEIGPYFDPQRPVNTSPNNTGAKILPPAQPAMIYYPYVESREFEGLGKGGRTAMAGPVYYYDNYPPNSHKLPRNYDGKFFFYDWIRDWIMAATFDKNNNLVDYEPFLPSFDFSNIMDMTIAPDGTMYILEYGMNWFSQNMDATLSRIDYAEGNRVPVAKIAADKTVGAAPFKVMFSAEKSFDYDKKDQLTYEWSFTGPDEKQAEGKTSAYTFEKPGIYNASVKVVDLSGDYSIASLQIKVGNDMPKVDIDIAGNNTFYWDDEPVKYAVKVNDTEDGQYPGNISKDAIALSIDYMPVGFDETVIAQGHQQKSDLLDGAALVKGSDCFSCHKINEKSIGPQYLSVADRYDDTDENIAKLAQKVIKGGNGVWGEQNMSAHPQLSLDEAKAMVKYVLSLNDLETKPSYALEGSFMPKDQEMPGTIGYYVFNTTYTDRGGNVIGPLKVTKTVRLRNAKLEAESYDDSKNVNRDRSGGNNIVFIRSQGKNSYLEFNDIDLAGIQSFKVRGGAIVNNFNVQIRQDSVGGNLVSEFSLPEVTDQAHFREVSVPVGKYNDGKHALFFVLQYSGSRDGVYGGIDWILFENDLKSLAKK